MDVNVIPQKTPTGAEEIRTRAHKLESRLRALLIQVDGRRSINDLQATIGIAAESDLRMLRDLGLISWDNSLSALRATSTQ